MKKALMLAVCAVFVGIVGCASKAVVMDETVSQELAGIADIDAKKKGTVVVLKKEVSFASNSAELTLQSKKNVDEAAKVFAKIPSITVIVEGHTDNKGEGEYNKMLSEQRAKVVAGRLAEKGVKKLEYKGYGADKAIADNDTEEGRAQNRRVEFVLVKDAPAEAK